jgi:hypothetical protein
MKSNFQRLFLQVMVFWGLLLSLGATLPAHAQTDTYNGDTSAVGVPTFNRPIEDGSALSGIGTAVRYQTRNFTPTTTGNFRIISTAAGGWDNFVFVYTGSFNPASPLTNYYAGNDDFGGIGTSGFASLNLTAGTTYVIVTTGYENTDDGAYTNVIGTAQVNGDTTGGATFARPTSSNTAVSSFAPIYPVDAVSTTVNAVRYQAKTFTVGESGLYRVQSEAVTAGYDPFTILYRGSFNPASPLTNAIIANDDLGGTAVSGFDIGLEAGQTYVMVTTGYSNSEFGQYFFSTTKLLDFRAGFTGSTVGRPTLDATEFGELFEPDITDFGNAVPFRAFRVSVATAGTYRFQLFSRTFTATAYNPLIAFYDTPFDNADPAFFNNGSGLQFVTTDYPLLDTGEVELPAGDYTIVVSGYSNTDAGDFRLEAFGEGAVTVTPVSVIKGTVTIKALVDTPPASPVNYPVKFTFSPTSGTDFVVNTTVSSATGNYLLNIPEGTYDVGIKSRTLQKVVTNVNATTGLVTGLNALNLEGADANDDNFTDIADLLALIGAYNQVSPAAGYNAAADFNFDGINDIADLLITIAYYNQSGQFLP